MHCSRCSGIFVDGMKMTHSWGSKFVAIEFFFIIHTENNLFVVLEFVDRTLHENHENWYPTKIKPFWVYFVTTLLQCVRIGITCTVWIVTAHNKLYSGYTVGNWHFTGFTANVSPGKLHFQQYNHDIRAGTIQTVYLYPLNKMLQFICLLHVKILTSEEFRMAEFSFSKVVFASPVMHSALT